MHLHHLTLQRQTEYLRAQIAGAQIAGSYTQLKNEWIMVLGRGGEEDGCLQLGCDAQYPYILFSEHSRRGKNSTAVMEELAGAIIADIRLLPGERIIEIRFERSENLLLLQFFTAHSNFFLLDKERRILNSFKAQRKNLGNLYLLPQEQQIDTERLAPGELVTILKNFPQERLKKALQKFQFMTRPVIQEACFRAQLPEEVVIKQLRDQQIQFFAEALLDFIRECRSGSPRIYFRDGLPEKFAIAELHHLKGYEKKEFGDLNAALRFFCFQALKYRGVNRKKAQLTEALERKLRSLQHALLKLQDSPAPDPEKREYYQKIGQLLISQPKLLKSGREIVELIDYYHPDLPTIQVNVKPELSAQENAQIYFEKAKQSDAKVREAGRRKAELEKQIEELSQLRRDLEGEDSLKKLDHIEETLKSRHLLSYRGEEVDQFRLPYKKYEYKGYEIRVGRNARDNDVLTFKHSGKEDIWLHAQGYSGSHVTIHNPQRLEQLPKDVLEYAARLAVTFSAAKHAGYVPVVYTRVKHVRKPRKSPPGTVIPEQAKTIFADPLQL